MKTEMLINAVEPEELRVAFVKDGELDGFQIETSKAEQKAGNIYKGVVARSSATRRPGARRESNRCSA
jgi:ribonuclease E